MSFTTFQELPVEIRLMIWGRVPQPARLIGQVPCSNCAGFFKRVQVRNSQRTVCIGSNHPDCRLRFILQRTDEAEVIFSPLHACHESRSVWLPRYFQPPRYISLSDHGYQPDALGRNTYGREQQSSYSLRFDTPFISYDADTFAIFDTWNQSQIDINEEPIVPDNQDLVFFDPFLGLDRARIQHIAMGESAQYLPMAVLRLDLFSLPMLRQLSVLSYGPQLEPRVIQRGSEMRVSDFHQNECTVFRIADALISTHARFNKDRLHSSFECRPHVRPLGSYMAVLKAFLWHSAHRNLEVIRQEAFDTIQEFEDFAISLYTPVHVNGSLPDCPLQQVPGCGIHGHGTWEMESWEPPFEIDNLLICEKSGVEYFFGESAIPRQWS